MSLHTLAQHLQSAGRGDDKVLVHMTPHEVSGLQSLAMAHGGSLTINPQTGLPEAGFLSGILPMLAGAALTVGTGGAINPLTAGLITGAVGTATTGSLSKGLMMGLGAYGGAGLAAGLGGAAAGAAAAAGPQMSVAPSMAGMGTAAASTAPTAYGALTAPAATAAAPGTFAFIPGTNVNAMFPAAAQSATAATTPAAAPLVSTAEAPLASLAPQSAPSVLEKVKGMGSRAFDLVTGTGEEADKAREEFLKKYKTPLIAGGLSTLMLSQEQPKPPRQEATQYTTFNPTYNRIAQSGGNYQAGPYPSMTGERRYFADGGLADLPVARMSQQNMTGGNENYPMARIKPYGYAVPRNVPVSENVIKPMDYQSVDPYTGEQKFAGGGLTSLVEMARGGFVSKLKAVPKPAEVKPKLQSTAALDKQIASLEKYANADEVAGRYNDLQNQIKELQGSKKERDAQALQAKKEYEAAIAAINKQKTADLTGLNADFASRIKGTQAEYAQRIKETQADFAQRAKNEDAELRTIKDAKERAARQKDIAADRAARAKDLAALQGELPKRIAEIQAEQKRSVTDLNNDFANRIKDRQGEYKAFQNDLTNFNKDYTTQLANLNKESNVAKNATTFAKQYQTAVANRDKLVAANELAQNKARETYEAAMAKYNEYQDKLSAEKQAWQEETGSKATGVQAIRPQTITKSLAGTEQVKSKIAELQKQLEGISPWDMTNRASIQKQIDELKAGTSVAAGYTPAYIKDPKTGKLIPSSEVAPITEFKPFTKVPGYDTTRRLMEENDITAVFEDVAGRRPTKAEMDRFLGTQTTDAAIAQFAMNQPDVKATTQYTDDDFKENFQYYIGREPTGGEMAAMKKAKITNFNQMRNFLQQQPAYLKNLNTVAQQAFQAQQKTAEEALSEQTRMAASLTPEVVSSTYKDVLGRPPTMEELRQYMGKQQTSEGLAGILKGSEEYLGTLTKPLVPIPQPVSQPVPQPTVAPIPFTRYAPGTVLEYTPEKAATTGLGAITGGVQPTPSGLQAPLTRGAVTLEGAMPLNPTFQEQMGLQTLATQAAQAAPPLQTGMKFEAQQPNIFGFQPYGGQVQSPQSVEAALAALRQAKLASMPGMAAGGYAGGGYHLGDYSDGGRLLKGPGDGVSDSIPASIGGRQPARLADGEFVIPARIVSELGNGSTDAGARKLYAMMDRIQRARRRSVGKDRVAVDSKAEKLLPA